MTWIIRIFEHHYKNNNSVITQISAAHKTNMHKYALLKNTNALFFKKASLGILIILAKR